MKIAPFHILLTAVCLLAASGSAVADKEPADIVVYYFHRTGRCQTCLAMEAWTRQVVELLNSGEVSRKTVLYVVNLDMPENEHFVQEFEITFNTVVIAKLHNGKPARWKNLADIWDFRSDEPAFKKHIERELTAF